MRKGIVGSSCLAALLACAVAAAGQTSAQAPTQAPVQGGASQNAPNERRSTASARTSTAQDVTIVGCVQLAPNPTAGNGSHELILADAVLSDQNPHPAATTGQNGPPDQSAQSAAGAPATAPPGSAARSYVLTGTQSKQLAQYIGHRVVVIGRVKGGALPADSNAGSGQTATGTTGTGTPMPRVTVVSVQPRSGSCS
jgi:hypothetical protein